MAEKMETKANKLLLIKGYLFPNFLTEEWLVEASNSFTPRDTDIFISSYPKSGTHWLAHIIYLLKMRERLSKVYLSKHATFFEGGIMEGATTNRFQMTQSQIDLLPDPRFFFTHFPFSYLPQNNPNTKFLYIYRNPKDVLLSMYNHFSNNKIGSFQGTFDEFFQFFIENNCFNYSSHIKHYIEHKDNPNLYIISYEELHAEFKNKLEDIAKFLECELTEELYKLILKETNYEAMRENPLINEQDMMKEGKYLFSKGKVGNWKTSLTQEQSEQIDKLISSQLGKDFIGSYISYSAMEDLHN